MTLTWKRGPGTEKIPLLELEEAFDILGKEAKSMVIAHLLAFDKAKTHTHIQQSVVEEVLQSLFGEGSQILLSIIKTRQ